jgi:hypothetical protein
MKTQWIIMNLAVCSFFGCADFLDVNEDPNLPHKIDLDLSFASSLTKGSESLESFYNLTGGFWSQYWTQSNTSSTYVSFEYYKMEDFKTQAVNDSYNWNKMYIEVLLTLKNSMNYASEQKQWDYLLMNTVIFAYMNQVMVDFYDKIPYFEALKGFDDDPIFNPKYDAGREVYFDLITKLDMALERSATIGGKSYIDADYLFKGNMDLWRCFANTLKLKIYLRMAYSDPSIAKQGISKMYKDGSSFLSTDAKIDHYISWDNNPNPLYYLDRVKYSTSTNLKLSHTLAKYYIQNNDPRLQFIIDPLWDQDSTIANGMPQGGCNISTDLLPFQEVDVFNLQAKQAVYFISEVESYLLQAEAIIRGWGNGNDKYLYNKAITVDFKRKLLEGQEIPLISEGGLYAYPENGSLNEKLKTIIMSKWAAFPGTQGAEAFFEANRTGFPQISSTPSWIENDFNPAYHGGELTYSLCGETNGMFPKRMIYPETEILHNKNFPGQSKITDRVWWDVNDLQ